MTFYFLPKQVDGKEQVASALLLDMTVNQMSYCPIDPVLCHHHRIVLCTMCGEHILSPITVLSANNCLEPVGRGTDHHPFITAVDIKIITQPYCYGKLLCNLVLAISKLVLGLQNTIGEQCSFLQNSTRCLVAILSFQIFQKLRSLFRFRKPNPLQLQIFLVTVKFFKLAVAALEGCQHPP